MKTIIAIIVIGLLTAFALYQGINGALLATSFTLLGGLGGYAISKKA